MTPRSTRISLAVKPGRVSTPPQALDKFRLLVGRAEIAARVERLFHMVEKPCRSSLVAAPWAGLEGGVVQRVETRLHPFIGHQQHGLGEVQRGEGRIDREGDDLVGERDFLVGEARAFAAEENADLLAGAWRWRSVLLAKTGLRTGL